VQKEAFERGRAQERKDSGEALRGAAGALQRAAAAYHAALEVARRSFEEFGLDLGLLVAEELVGATIRRDEHDVRGIVRRILAEALPEAGGAEVVLEAHPDDLHLLPNDLALPFEGAKLRTVADPRLARGSFRARSEGLEVFAGIAERLEAIRVKLHQEAGHGAA
jgi:flagellar biosynthesis/type III secretory pathway protein FliH